LVRELNPHALPRVIPREGFEDSQEVVVSRFEWTFKGGVKDKEIADFTADVLAELLKVMPINAPCSFAGRNHY
jgi:hypothetical protein